MAFSVWLICHRLTLHHNLSPRSVSGRSRVSWCGVWSPPGLATPWARPSWCTAARASGGPAPSAPSTSPSGSSRTWAGSTSGKQVTILLHYITCYENGNVMEIWYLVLSNWSSPTDSSSVGTSLFPPSEPSEGIVNMI